MYLFPDFLGASKGGDLSHFIAPKSVGLSDGQFYFVGKALKYARRELFLGTKIIW